VSVKDLTFNGVVSFPDVGVVVSTFEYSNVLTFLFRQEQLVACEMPAPIPRALRDASVSTGSRKKPV